MENRINIAELLKGCPQGMELDSTMYDNLYFDSLDADYNGIIICYTLIAGTKTSISFTKYGTFNNHMGAKCVIFPKGKTTWEGFQRPFKDGDIVFTTLGNIAIIRKPIGGELFCVYGIMVGNGFYKDETAKVVVARLATEEEKQKLFNAIKKHGYKWNDETKTLDKLSKFKDGDILYIRTANTWICIYKEGGEKENVYYKYVATSSVMFVHDNSPLCIREHVKEIRLATKDEQQKLFDVIKENGYRWNFQAKRLEELITPIFKKGDKIRVRNGVSESRIIDDVCDTFYTLVPIGTIDFTEQNRWELVPDKLIKPNFRVGDTIQDVDGYKVEITKVDIDGEYYEYLSIIAKGIGSIPFKYQNEWNLVSNKAVGPKFKVGDKIRHKEDGRIREVAHIFHTDGNFRAYEIKVKDGIFESLFAKNQYQWEAVPSKFDITTLKPFDKVLVKSGSLNKWHIQLFEKYDKACKYPFICMGYNKYKECIPYEGNEHLLDTTVDCDNFYKTWEQ
jgi:hypothetical protein